MSEETEKLRILNKSTAIQTQHVFDDQTENMIQSDNPDHVHGKNCSHGHGKSKDGKKRKPAKNFGIIAYTVFTCLSCFYLEVYQFYQYHPDPYKRQILPIISYFVVFFALWSYYQTITTDNHINKVKGSPNLENNQYLNTNYLNKNCDVCNYHKMPRVSHCSTCGTCILKLDHHCMWTQNCIGYRNQKTFYYFTVWMTMGLLQFWTATYTTYTQLSGGCNFFSYFEPGVYVLWGITCFSASVVGIMIVALFFSHTMMVLTNNTTLMQIKAKKVCPFPFCECRPTILEDGNVNQFDRGEIQNIRNLFGTKNIIHSLLPLTRQVTHDFLCEKPNPLPTPIQIARHLGSIEGDILRQKELRDQLIRIKDAYKGKKFRIHNQIIEL